MRFAMYTLLCVAAASVAFVTAESFQIGRINNVVNNLLLDTPTPAFHNEAGEPYFHHAVRMLAPSGKQMFYEYKAAVKKTTAILDGVVNPNAVHECEDNSMTIAFTEEELRGGLTPIAFAEQINIRVGSFVHGDKTFGCFNADVNGPGPFYREVEAVSVDSEGRLVLTTSNADPSELFSEFEYDMKELPMSDADWRELAASPAVTELRNRLAEEGKTSLYASAAEEEERLFEDHKEIFRLPITEENLERLRGAVSPADAMVLAQQQRERQAAHNAQSNGGRVSAVYFGSEDASVYNIGDTMHIATDHSGFPATGSIKIRVFGDPNSWEKSASTFRAAFTGPLDDGIEFAVTNALKTDVKLFADACFYNGATPEPGFSCSGAAAIVDVCSLDDMHCKSGNKIFVVDTHSLFVVTEPASGEIAPRGKTLTAKLMFHGTRMEDVTVTLMRYRMLALSDEEIASVDLTLKPNMMHTLTFKPSSGGIDGSIYPYFIRVKYNCGWFRCTKWKSYFFTVPKLIVADWSAKNEDIVDVDCKMVQKACSAASAFVRKAQCHMCDKVKLETTVTCKSCEIDGFVAIGGVRLRLLDQTENRFMVTVTGDYKANLDMLARMHLAYEGTRDLPSATIPLAGIDFKVAGITFTIAVKMGVELSVGYSIDLNGEVRYTAEIDQPPFATVVKYGTHSGSAGSAVASKTATIKPTLAGQGMVSVTVTPLIAVVVSQIVDINLKVPLFLQLDLTAHSAGLPATTKRPDAIIRRGDCTGEHRVEYLGTAGARKLVAHAESHLFKKWIPKKWDWTLWDGNSFKLIHGCAFPFTSSTPRFRVAFSGAWDWEVPSSFTDTTHTRQFLGLVAEDFGNILTAPVARFLVKPIALYPANSAVEGALVTVEDAEASAADITVDLAVASGLFPRLASQIAAAADANAARRVVVVEVGVLEDDKDSPTDPKGRSAATLRQELQTALSNSAKYPNSMIVHDTVCAPMLSCSACVASAQAKCAYCPTNGRCEASTTASSCAKSFVTSSAKCPNEAPVQKEGSSSLPSWTYAVTAAAGAGLILAVAIAVVAAKRCRASKEAPAATTSAYVTLVE